jgi:hypothetical protein
METQLENVMEAGYRLDGLCALLSSLFQRTMKDSPPVWNIFLGMSQRSWDKHLKLEVYPGLNPGRCAVAIRLVKAWKLGVALEYLDGSWVKENMCCYT